jgi:Xaa-Pro aminopeptidase
MKSILYIILVLIIVQSFVYSFENNSINPNDLAIPNEQLTSRRNQLIKNFSDESFLIFLSADYFINKRDISSKTLISPNQLYLSGIKAPKTILLMIPGGLEYKEKVMNEILFISSQTAENIIWNGPELNLVKAKKLSNIENILDFSEFDSILSLLIDSKDTVFFDRISHTKHFSITDNNKECEIEIINKIFQQKSDISFVQQIPFINEMRQFKDNYEIEIMQKAVDITKQGHLSAMRNAKPGMFEYQIQSFMEFEFLFNGSERPAYTSIIGAGANSCYLHYTKNSAQAQSGDLVLMDCGAKYKGYCADITRTFPISGKFSEEQKIIYNIVLSSMDSAMTVCKPGEEFSNIHKKAKEVISNRLTELGIVQNDEDTDKYFPHGTSHFIGLDVHDVGSQRILEEGMVLTIEPGIYIRENSNCDNKWWNIGIRIEDNILITKNGFRNLSGNIPKTIEEIELLMKQ